MGTAKKAVAFVWLLSELKNRENSKGSSGRRCILLLFGVETLENQ